MIDHHHQKNLKYFGFPIEIASKGKYNDKNVRNLLKRYVFFLLIVGERNKTHVMLNPTLM